MLHTETVLREWHACAVAHICAAAEAYLMEDTACVQHLAVPVPGKSKGWDAHFSYTISSSPV